LGADEALQFLVQFMPVAHRTIQSDGLTPFNLRYWHPIFAAWREMRRKVLVRYYPENLSRIFVSAGGKRYIEVGFADIHRPPISLWEHRAAAATCVPRGTARCRSRKSSRPSSSSARSSRRRVAEPPASSGRRQLGSKAPHLDRCALILLQYRTTAGLAFFPYPLHCGNGVLLLRRA
jgi:putative transposase